MSRNAQQERAQHTMMARCMVITAIRDSFLHSAERCCARPPADRPAVLTLFAVFGPQQVPGTQQALSGPL